ncbi:MAG TPA: bifunctional adenosylcobinamide kinase/adenosylcobinamide-phosphate guanylyltransferase [Burkholderiales bacterium]|nr:bifunctional adenosylcobinamide kinase/adenosylcobinamide-phosphate guanylyltransferase [Burkholderiales bacterium]
MKTLILGGVRSGKSRLAETLALRSQRRVSYIATATADDAEMHERIAAHRQRRPADWILVEEPMRLSTTLQKRATENTFVIVDCLTLWLTNLLLAADSTALNREKQALLDSLPRLAGDIVFVSNETGMGVTPMGELTRRFVDEAGQLHQQLAQTCERVVLTVAGLPSVLKGEPL